MDAKITLTDKYIKAYYCRAKLTKCLGIDHGESIDTERRVYASCAWLKLSDVMYITTQSHDLADDSKEGIIIYMNTGERFYRDDLTLEAMFEQWWSFIYVHRSYIVNHEQMGERYLGDTKYTAIIAEFSIGSPHKLKTIPVARARQEYVTNVYEAKYLLKGKDD